MRINTATRTGERGDDGRILREHPARAHRFARQNQDARSRLQEANQIPERQSLGPTFPAALRLVRSNSGRSAWRESARIQKNDPDPSDRNTLHASQPPSLGRAA
jgi:hypothetical protein